MNQSGDFTTKATLYQYRWDYAPAAIEAICAAMAGCEGKSIADLGAGNGVAGTHFLAHGAQVYAVDPNHAMLAQAQAALGHYPTFHTLCAHAESTTLPAQAMDAIVVGRALHWFTPEPACQEMRRILKPNGWLAILRVQAADKQLREALLSLRSTENGWNMQHGGGRPPLPPYAYYFGHNHYQSFQFSQAVSQNWEQFWCELCSRSAAPDADHQQISRFRQAAYQLFTQLSCNGCLTFETLTLVSLGQMSAL